MNLVIKTEQNQHEIVEMLNSMGIKFDILYTGYYEGVAEVYNCSNVPDVLPDNFIVDRESVRDKTTDKSIVNAELPSGNKITIQTETTFTI